MRSFLLRTYAFVAGSLWLSIALSASTTEFQTTSKQALLVDITHTAVLYEKAAREPMTPSSMTKMMTVYLVFEGLSKGTLTLEQTFNVSEKAWRMGGSRMFVEVGNKVPLLELLQGIIVSSGNDACVTVAEGMWGTEEAFANAMNKKAKDMGLTGTMFQNSSGWPAENHYSTAYDLHVIARRTLEDFPDLYKRFYSQTSYTYNKIRQPNRNDLLNENIGVTGLKTGHTESGDFGITVAQELQGRKFVVVVNGHVNHTARIEQVRSLLAYGQMHFQPTLLAKAEAEVGRIVIAGSTGEPVPLVAHEPLTVLGRVGSTPSLQISVEILKPKAPIQQGDVVAHLTLESKDPVGSKVIKLYTTQAVNEASIFRRAWNFAKNILGKGSASQNHDLLQSIEATLGGKPTPVG